MFLPCSACDYSLFRNSNKPIVYFFMQDDTLLVKLISIIKATPLEQPNRF